MSTLKMSTVSLTVLTLGLAVVGTARAASTKAIQPIFRSKVSSTWKTVGLKPLAGWQTVDELNRDPLALAQWTAPAGRNETCSTGAPSRISAFAVDAGQQGVNKLLQMWFPTALRFDVRDSEDGFLIVRTEKELVPGTATAQTVLAFPLSDANITPLAGWIDGVKIVLVAESTTLSPSELESTLRKAIRAQTSVNAKAVRKIDTPYVLANRKWNKALAERLETSKEPGALISRAYESFAQGGVAIAAGQKHLQKAADAGSVQAKMDLARLYRNDLLRIEVEPDEIEKWVTELAFLGQDDARYWKAQETLIDDEGIPALNTDEVKELSSCGQPEARRAWANRMARSFEERDRKEGKTLLIKALTQVPLEGPFAITTRVPRAVEGLSLTTLKSSLLPRYACADEGAPKTQKKIKEEGALADTKELDRLVNAGSQKKIKEAVSLACQWPGTRADRNRLVSEIVVRRDSLTKWRAFKACEVVSDRGLVQACLTDSNQRGLKQVEGRFKTLLQVATPSERRLLKDLRARAGEFHDQLIAVNQERVSKLERDQLLRLRIQMENELMDLLAVTMTNRLDSQVKAIITGRRLLVIEPDATDATYALHRQPASGKFLRSELLKLEQRLNAALGTIDEAHEEEIGTKAKADLVLAKAALPGYQQSFEKLLRERVDRGASKEVQSTGRIWLHLQNISLIEQARDRAYARPKEINVM